MRISDWSSDVCSSDLRQARLLHQIQHAAENDRCTDTETHHGTRQQIHAAARVKQVAIQIIGARHQRRRVDAGQWQVHGVVDGDRARGKAIKADVPVAPRLLACPRDKRSEEHTSELQSLMRISYAVFCLKKKKQKKKTMYV